MRRSSRDWVWGMVASLVALAVYATACEGLRVDVSPVDSSTTSASKAVEGAEGGDVDLAGLGDEYFPLAGNGGYDARHYEIELTCDPSTGELSGTTTIELEALQVLETFHLDLVGLEVAGVEIDGVAAGYQREGQELIVQCPEALAAGQTVSVAVTYSGKPIALMSADGFPVGWQWVEDTIYTLDEPEGAATWYPVNDHPSDKATYEFRITVPRPFVAAASGVLLETLDGGNEQTYVWAMEQPMASYLAAVAVGEFVVEETTSPEGVPIRNYFDSTIEEEAAEAFAITGEVIDYFSELFGAYPFDAYGVVVPDATIGAAMENQSLSLFGRDVVEETMADPFVGPMFLAHELAHQWFGDSVTLGEWRDIWLNEGFAMYAGWLWAEHDIGPRGMTQWVNYARESLAAEDETPPGDPGTEDLFGTGVYERGGLTLHALRLTVGDEIFFRILREWVSRHAYGNVTTEDFMSLVQEKAGHLSGFDVDMFFQGWLFDEEMPRLPEMKAAD
jgi:aminopeptidase N